MDDARHISADRTNRRRLRDRVLPWITLLVAVGWVVAARQIAPRVREYNANRAFLGAMTAAMVGSRPATASAPAVSPRTGLPWISFPPAPDSQPSEPSAASASTTPGGPSALAPLPPDQLIRATAFAESAVYVWERLVYGVAVAAALAAVVGTLFGRVRIPHLLAAAAMCLGTLGTLIVMGLLVDPARGAFHPLGLEAHLLAALAGLLYPLVLLIAFARKPRAG